MMVLRFTLSLISMLALCGCPQVWAQETPLKKSGSNPAQVALDLHRQYIDSANHYKALDLEKSINFIASSMEQLGSSGNRREFSLSLSTLGEIYMYHKQYDLAIANFKDALNAYQTQGTKLLLGRAYVLNREFQLADSTLSPLVGTNRLVPYQMVELYEALGDAHKGMSNLKNALDYYQEALKIAQKNQISPKQIDLNSKIADAYAAHDR